MKVSAKKRFFRDLAKIKSLNIIDTAEFIFDIAFYSSTCEEIPGFKFLRQYKNFGRIEIAPYRIGVQVEGNAIVFVCIIHRSVFYEQFP